MWTRRRWRNSPSGLREHDLDIRWAVETILRSELFFSDANIASRVSSPVEYLLGAVRSLEMLETPPSTLILAEWCTRLGQDLFYPPNVGGWTGGRSWLTSRTIVGRANFAAALVAGELRAPPAPPRLRELASKCECRQYGRINPRSFFESLLLGTATGSSAEPLVAEAAGGSDRLGLMVAMLLSRPEGS